MLHLAILHLAGEVGDQFALLAQGLEQAFALVGIAGVDGGDGVAALAPVFLGEVRVFGDGGELDPRADLAVCGG